MNKAAQFRRVHLRKHPPQRGIGSDHRAARTQPPFGLFAAGEEVDLVEALLAQSQGTHHQKEDLGDRDLRPLARLEEVLGLCLQIELVGAETGEVC